ncbi:uroporphyrinogen decarboxylase [Acetobacteraceae bacterium ESL0709]|nr:uroporphyrinogen decarboxylase [Acetobacteraceae bacterium ESL0697]MDF7677109.1 uroporphyrinogen decarboxylase [Acetobacteraceae bacterium ESL0709]
MTSHNSLSKPLLNVLQGRKVWPPPIWLMRQAGRYLPEFQALRAKANFLTRCMTPDIAVELTLQPIRRYQMDGAILFSDILILPWVMGQSLNFIEGKGPVLEPIREERDLNALNEEKVFEAIAPVRETLSILSQELPSTTTLLGFAGSPFTVACYMVEGGGSRDFAQTRKMMLQNPVLFQKLMTLLTRATANMLSAHIQSGAEAVMLFDSWGGILPPEEFRKFVTEPTRQIVEILKSRHPETPVIGFPRLGGIMSVDYAQKTGLDCLALDTVADMARIAEMIPENMALQGNLDPMILLNGGEPLVTEARRIRDSLKGRRHIFNLGHGVMQQTPPENVSLLVETVRSV